MWNIQSYDENKDLIDLLSDALIKYETLTKEQFNKMSLNEQLEVFEKTPELYKELTN